MIITWSMLFATSIFVAGWVFNNEMYNYILQFLKNEYISALVCWVSRVLVISQLGRWITPMHPDFMQVIMGWHIIEGVLMILILIVGAFATEEK